MFWRYMIFYNELVELIIHLRLNVNSCNLRLDQTQQQRKLRPCRSHSKLSINSEIIHLHIPKQQVTNATAGCDFFSY